jgi:hypothetical protein
MSDQELTGQPTPETEAPEAAQEAVIDESQTDGEAVEKEEVPAAKTFTQKELDEILQKRLAKERSRSERIAKEAYREALQAVTQQPRSTVESSEPTRDQFASDAEWIDAKVEFKLEQRDRAAALQKQQAAQQTIASKTEDLYAKAEKVAGFDRETFDELPLTKTIASAVLESEFGPQLMAHLSANPEDAERISKLSDTRQAIELGKLEAKLQAAPKTTKTTPPITPIGQRGSASADLASADFATYKKLREKQGARWAR